MASEEMESKRSYLNDRYAWTEEDVQKLVTSTIIWPNLKISNNLIPIRFNEAYSIYGDGPKANKLIADFIGNGNCYYVCA